MKAYRTVQVVAWGVLLLLVAIPLYILAAVRAASSWWVIWSVISIWATLDSRNLANAAFPERVPRQSRSAMIVALGILNLLISLYAVLLPGGDASAWR